MPHVNIKHFSDISSQQRDELSSAITNAITQTLGCDESVVSIALEQVKQELWNELVYVSEIKNKSDLLCKKPGY